MNTAKARRYDVANQLSRTAYIANYFPMVGMAILTEEAMKGGRKETIGVMSNTAFLFMLVSRVLCISVIITHFNNVFICYHTVSG